MAGVVSDDVTPGCAGCEHLALRAGAHSKLCLRIQAARADVQARTIAKRGPFAVRMMPGETPYTPEELARLRAMMP